MKRGSVVLLVGMMVAASCALVIPNLTEETYELRRCIPNTSDAYEPNNNFTQAKPIDSGTYTLDTTADRYEYFYVNVPSYYEISVEISWNGPFYDLDLYLYNSAYTEIGSSNSSHIGEPVASESISYTAQSTGNYFIYIYNTDSNGFMYTLTVNVHLSPFISCLIAFGIISIVIVGLIVVKHNKHKKMPHTIRRQVSRLQQTRVPVQTSYFIASSKSEENRKYCHNCGAEQSPLGKFCYNCGAEQSFIEKYCHNCGVQQSPLETYCHNCGVKSDMQ